MGQKHLPEPDRIGEQQLHHRRFFSQPSIPLSGLRDVWPFLLLVFFLALIVLLVWAGQVWG